jgi:hypothetical protein
LEIEVIDEHVSFNFNPPFNQALESLLIQVGEPPLGDSFSFFSSSHIVSSISGSSSAGRPIPASTNLLGGVTIDTSIHHLVK